MKPSQGVQKRSQQRDIDPKYNYRNIQQPNQPKFIVGLQQENAIQPKSFVPL